MLKKFLSSTREIPETNNCPEHIAIIMDGNGRWAKARYLPRIAGHAKGVEVVRSLVKSCIERKIKYLTLFAFSSENWRRPGEEVNHLMRLFSQALINEVNKLHANNVRLRVIGDLERFGKEINNLINIAEDKTKECTSLNLTIAANYGGRWDIIQAINHHLAENNNIAENSEKQIINEQQLEAHLALNFAPEPDLFIRTGGEQRISNFLLWQLAYSEFYFTDTLWPDFDDVALDLAINSYKNRERRFGRTSEQISK